MAYLLQTVEEWNEMDHWLKFFFINNRYLSCTKRNWKINNHWSLQFENNVPLNFLTGKPTSATHNIYLDLDKLSHFFHFHDRIKKKLTKDYCTFMEFVVVRALWPTFPTYTIMMNFGSMCISVIRMREDIKYNGSHRKLNDTLFYFCVRIVLSTNSILAILQAIKNFYTSIWSQHFVKTIILKISCSDLTFHRMWL